MPLLVSRARGGVDFVAVLSVVSVILLLVTLGLCNTEARAVLAGASSVFVGLSLTAFFYSSSLLLNVATFCLVALATKSFIENFLQTTT